MIDIYQGHHYEPTQAQASAISLKRGMDNECADGSFKVKDDRDYKAYLDAVKEGYLKESDIDRGAHPPFYRTYEAWHFRPARYGAIHQNR